MPDTLVLALPTGYRPGQDIIHPDDPPGEWDWLVALLTEPIRISIWDSLIAFVSGELDILLSPLYEIRDRIYWAVEAISALPGRINAAVYSLRDDARNALYAVRDQVRDALASVRDVINNSLTYWLNQLMWAAYAVRDQVRDTLYSLRDVINNSLTYWLGQLMWAAYAVRDQVRDTLANLRDVINNTLVYWLSQLMVAAYAVRDQVRDTLANLRDVINNTLVYWINQVVVALTSLPGRIEELYHASEVWWDAQVAKMWNDLVAQTGLGWGTLLDIGTSILTEVSRVLAAGPPPELQAAADRFTASLEAGLSAIQDVMLGQGQVTPELAPELAVRAFLTASSIGFGAHILATAIELAHPLRYIGLHYLSGFLGQMGSFNTVAYAAMGVMVREAVANPMAYNIRSRTRPTIPTAGDLQAMRRKHNLTAAEFGANMAYQGYTDFWIQRMEEYLPADPRLMEIVRIADTCLPSGSPPADALPLLERLGITTREAPDWWLEMKLALAGYNWIDIPQLKEVIKKRLVQSEYNRLIATSSVAFRRGYMGRTQYEAELAAANQIPDMIAIRVHAEEISALVDDIADLEAMYIDSFKKDMITQDECLVALVNCGITRRKAEVLVNRAAVAKVPKPTRPAATEEEKALKELQTKYSELYRRQYEGDLITDGQYYDSLVAIGLEPRLATVTVQIAVTKKATSTKRVEIKAEEQAVATQRKVYEKLYKEQFQAGLLDADGYYELLVALGMSRQEAQGTVALELVKQYQLTRRAELKAGEKEALAVQKASAELYVRRYRAGDIDAAALLDRLLHLGLSPLLAEITVALEGQKRQDDAAKILAQVIVPALRVPFDLATTQLATELDAGEITRAEYYEQLLATGLAEEVAALILEFS